MQRRRFLAATGGLAALLAAAPLVAACGTEKAEATEARADVPRAGAGSGDARAFAGASTMLGWDLYRFLAGREQGNMFLSPYSIAAAMAMVTAGARGESAAQLHTVLHTATLGENLHPAFNALDHALAASAPKDGAAPFELATANSAWAQAGFAFERAYLETLARYYGAGVHLADFERKTEAARAAVNDWVEERTKDRIKDLLPKGSVDALTRLVLVNAIYFKADWLSPFAKESTAPGPFTTLAGARKDMPMMHQTASFAYAKGNGLEALELPYAGNAVSMVVLLPAAGALKEVEPRLATDAATLMAGMKSTRAVVTLPKWEFTSSFALRDAFTTLGARDPFDPGLADFSGMDGKRDLYVSDVFHKAFVRVDEKGTEAAAATGAVVGATSAPVDPPVQFTVDRPFVFLIRHRESGAVLFAGRVTDPA